MKIINQSVEILNISHPEPLKLIELIGRTCYKSECKITETSAYDFVDMLLKKKHEAVIEHVSATVKFITDRGVTHEIVRHRVASYAQESTRYCNYSKDKFGAELTFIKPEEIGQYESLDIWKQAMYETEKAYLNLIMNGASAQIARSVLPNSLKTELIMSANLREWRHFIRLRGSSEAHPQIRALTLNLLEQLREMIPLIFDDLGGN